MSDYLISNLRYLTHAAEMNGGQSGAGTAAGVGQPAISKIVNGVTKEPGYKTVLGLARHFGVSVDDLLNRDMQHMGSARPSQAAGIDDATMAQGVELLYLLADARPEDKRFQRPSWAMIQIAAKAVKRAEGSPRDAMAEILAELAKEV